MQGRFFPVAPEPADRAAAESLAQRRSEAAARILAEDPEFLLRGVPANLTEAMLRRVGADEGTVWLTTDGGDTLTAVWNNGPHAAEFAGRFSLPAARGLTGLAFTSELATCESEVCFRQDQHRGLDEALGLLTWALLAVPLRFAGEVRGVLTAVRVIRPADLAGLPAPPRQRQDFPPGFEPPPSFQLNDLAAMETAAAALGRLADLRLLCGLLDWAE